MPANDPTVKIGQFLGLRNRERPARMPSGALATAKNVDIDNTGGIATRVGYEALAGISGITSLYATRDGARMYAIAGGSLLRIHEVDPIATETIATGIGSGAVHWSEFGDRVILTGAARLEIEHSAVRPLDVTTGAPAYLSLTAGSLAPGRYRIGVVQRDAYGREGGCQVGEIDVPQGGGIRIEPPAFSGYTPVIYASVVDGADLFRYAEGGSCVIAEPHYATMAVSPDQIGASALPLGAAQNCVYQGRLFVAVPFDDMTAVYFSHPFWLHLFDLGRNFFLVPGRIELMVATSQGIVIGTDRAVHGYSDGGIAQVLDGGVPAGGQAAWFGDTVYFWTQNGFAQAFPFRLLAFDTFKNPTSRRAAIGIVKDDESDHLIASLGGVDA